MIRAVRLILPLLFFALITRAQVPDMRWEQMRLQAQAMQGKPVIPFSSTDIDKNPVSSELLKGKIYVLNFWFVACKPCQMEMPELNALVQKYKGTGVKFIAIALDQADEVKKFLNKSKFDYTHIADGRKITMSDFKIHMFPTHIIIDRQNNISYYTAAYSPETVHSLDKHLSGLLAQ